MEDTPSSNGSPTLTNYAALLRRRWWVLALGVVLGLVAGIVLTLVQQKSYTSTTSVLVEPTGVFDPTDSGGRTNSGINLDTEAQLVRSQVVASTAKALLKSDASTADLLDRVSVTVPPNTQVLAISYSSPTPAAAQAGSHAFANAYLAQRTAQAKKDLGAQVTALKQQKAALETELTTVSGQVAALPANSVDREKAQVTQGILSNQIAALGGRLSPLLATQVTSGEIITDADLPTSPSAPNRLINLASALFAGLLIALAAALTMNRFDRRIDSVTDLAAVTAMPVLVEVPRKELTAPLSSRTRHHGRHFGQLRNAVLSLVNSTTHLEQLSSPKSTSRARVVQLLGATPSAGTGLLAANLAAVLARPGHPVTLLCVDTASSSPAALGVTGKGMSDLLGGKDADITEIQQRSPVCPNVYVVVPGADADGAAELTAEALGPVVDCLLAYSDFVVLETRPARDSAEGQALAQLAQITLGVIDLRLTRREDVVEMERQFSQVEAPLAGFVVVPQVHQPPPVAAQQEKKRPAAVIPTPTPSPPRRRGAPDRAPVARMDPRASRVNPGPPA